MSRQIVSLKYNKTQHLDLYSQEQPGQPLVVCIHGGGFISGARDDIRCTLSAEFLTQAGFNFATLSYSLAPEGDRFLMGQMHCPRCRADSTLCDKIQKAASRALIHL